MYMSIYIYYVFHNEKDTNDPMCSPWYYEDGAGGSEAA